MFLEGSVKLVEHELWQREDKGLIGILSVQDAAEAATVDSALSQDDLKGTDFDFCSQTQKGTEVIAHCQARFSDLLKGRRGNSRPLHMLFDIFFNNNQMYPRSYPKLQKDRPLPFAVYFSASRTVAVS